MGVREFLAVIIKKSLAQNYFWGVVEGGGREVGLEGSIQLLSLIALLKNK